HQKQLGLFVFSGRNGRLRWHEPLTKRYGLTAIDNISPIEFDQGSVPLCIDDLNADGLLDVVVPGDAAMTEAKSEQGIAQKQLRVLDGKTGARLWQVAYPPARNPPRAFSETPPAAVIDFDGDRIPELVTFYFYTPPDASRSIAAIKAHAGSDGRELWARQLEVAAECGQVHLGDNEHRYRPQWLPLRTAA
ncbi:hypothetical protein RMSM_00345, partial [Rhodopirellula maiorica SM1]